MSFAGPLGSASDQISGISGFNNGNSAGFTAPPTVAFADATVPEPVSMVILGTGLFGLSLVRRKRA